MIPIFNKRFSRLLSQTAVRFLLALACLAASHGFANAQSIGVNFGAGRAGAALDPADVAGVVPASNWNNAAGATGSLVGIPDATGTATPTNVTWATDEEWSVGGTPANADSKLLNGFFSENNNDGSSITITGIPYATYDLYVYVSHDRLTEDVIVSEAGGAFAPFTAVENITDADITAGVSFLEQTVSGGGSGNYIHFPGLAATDLTLEMGAVDLGPGSIDRNAIAGIQIVSISAEYKFTISSGEATVTGYTGPGGDVVIPETLGGFPVVRIAANALANQTTIRELTIPGNVRVIGGRAFSGCSNLFRITMNEGVESIGSFAFSFCDSLTTVAIPNSVSTLGANPFARCAKLEAITVLLNHPNFAYLDGSVLSKDLSTFHCFPTGKSTVSIPPSVTTIADSAFLGATKLTSVTIPGSVTSIERQVFALCSSLTSVVIEPGVTSIGRQMFTACTSLASVTIPDSVTSIETLAFDSCTSLTDIYFRGSPPGAGETIFRGVPGTTRIVYATNATGWPAVYEGLPTQSNRIIHVDADSATPVSPYDTWGKAVRRLQDAILAARFGDEIWVAAGTYLPDDGDAVFNDDRSASFALKNGVAIIGGFAGNETDPSEADLTANVTTLSGIIAPEITAQLRSYHVVTATSVDASASLRNFRIRDGIANRTATTYSYGGGLYCFEASPIIENCIFLFNEADFGGAILNEGSSPTIRDCSFNRNEATVNGGAIHNFTGSAPTILDCTFGGNQAGSNGGAVINQINSSPSIVNCHFQGNFAGFGGALLNDNSSSPKIVNGVFLSNKAANLGGAILNQNSCAPVFTNCSFQGNQSGNDGGAVGSYNGSTPVFQNCIVWRNRANNVTNSASASLFDDGTSTAAYRACLIQNLNLGMDNFDGTNPANDPLFESEINPAFAPLSGLDSLRLQPTSPVLDRGVSALNPTAFDIDGNSRIQNTGIDLGAYEFVEFTYTETDGEITITGYSGSGGEVTIPSMIENVPVKTIALNAFLRNTNLTGVTIPDSVTFIGRDAFNAATSLERITIGRGVTTIEFSAFAFCSNLMEFVIDEANPNFNSSPDGVLFDKLGEILIAFPGGKAGTYDIPAGVTGIGAGAFSGCVNLTEVTIPSTVTGIGSDVFTFCPSLTAIRTDVANPNLSSTPDGVLLSKGGTTLIAYPPGKSGAPYAIPGGVEIIADFAFRFSTSLTSVTVPNTVTSIGRAAFLGCTNLIEIRFAGNAPTDGALIFSRLPEEARVYYFAGTTGWGATYGGIPTVEVSPAFASWIAGFPGVGSETGTGDDPDGDGVPSGVENFFGTDPSVPSAGIVIVGKSGSTFTFTHPQGETLAADLVAGYQWTTDLNMFHADGDANPAGTTTVTFSSQPDTPVAGVTTVTATIAGTVPESLHVRVAVALEELEM